MPPFLSVIVPVRDGGAAFRACLDGLARSLERDFELIVVDDGSRDGSAALAAGAGARVLAHPEARGPAAARNEGARAAGGEWLVFVDADCEVHPETLGRLAAALAASPELDAAFGSYDDAPPAPGLVSRYKNLVHHWVHQRGAGEAETFWAGCGAVRRTVFLDLGGFDAGRYPRPSIEDVELGFRLRAAGRRVLLLPDVQVRHHKRWTLAALLRSDLGDRALPWVELGLERGGLGGRLNLDLVGRASGVAAVGLLAGLAAAVVFPAAGLAVAAAAAGFLLIAHAGLYRLFARRGGLRLLAAGIALHWLYFAYSSLAYAVGLARHLAGGRGGAVTEAGR
ncbi:MAG TPA: glycosyltransferase family 2 protein [Thermoanaerobaculia bacterium]